MHDYGEMVQTLLRHAQLVGDKPQPYRKSKPGGKGKGYGTANQDRLRAAMEVLRAHRIGEQPVVPILPEDPNN